jgi:hypothetical protein
MFVSRNQMSLRIMKNDTHLIVQVKQLRRPKDVSRCLYRAKSQNDSAGSGNHFDFRFYPAKTLILFVFVNDFVIGVDHVVFPRSGIRAFSARPSLLRLLCGLLVELHR